MEKYHIEITGIVQGVGFRPFVYNLAKSLHLKGWVNNAGACVVIEVEGPKNTLDEFLGRLKTEAPSLSDIKDIHVELESFTGFPDFQITESIREEGGSVFISPDVSICDRCAAELFDKKDRRFLYPFINCTDCGPRFTIVEDIPYDRIKTTMKVFPMCGECSKEYIEPSNRRYHAQPVSCYECGPAMKLLDKKGNTLHVDNIIPYTINLLNEGRIIAIKGLGGYHLACDAQNAAAVEELRRRKVREDKPFALMVRDYETACKYCHINPEEKHLLESKKRPIVLLKKREDYEIPEDIAPLNPYLGLMLPYTPVHLLLFNYPCTDNVKQPGRSFDALVMTSGNRSSEPIYYKDEEAVHQLGEIADYFLTNNREIHTRVDDSVTRVFRGKEYIIRRSRGYVPAPITCEAVKKISMYRDMPAVLAAGGELKNTFCVNKGAEFFMSHHIGDLENYETLRSFEEGIDHFKRLFDIRPVITAYDLHPEYLSTQYALSLELEKKVGVQHHHAHIASCMADNELEGDVIGVAFDGTGYGEDGNVWGGEFFTGDFKGFTRQGHLTYVKMPGGDAAIKEPWRMAVSYYYHAFDPSFSPINAEAEMKLYFPNVEENKLAAVFEMLRKNINSPLTSSMGRLFDAAAALIGIRQTIHYEGQAAIELEYRADEEIQGCYGFSINESNDVFAIDVRDTIRGIVYDLQAGATVNAISSKFHETVADIILQGCEYIKRKTALQRVALSGGVFQNMTLLEKSVRKLEKAGFKVYTHSRVPSNDAGIALGQAAMAAVGRNKIG